MSFIKRLFNTKYIDQSSNNMDSFCCDFLGDFMNQVPGFKTSRSLYSNKYLNNLFFHTPEGIEVTDNNPDALNGVSRKITIKISGDPVNLFAIFFNPNNMNIANYLSIPYPNGSFKHVYWNNDLNIYISNDEIIFKSKSDSDYNLTADLAQRYEHDQALLENCELWLMKVLAYFFPSMTISHDSTPDSNP